MKSKETIIQAIKHRPKGKPFTATELLTHGSYENIRQVLSRLAKNGEITRVSRGIYVRPITAPFVGAILPETEEIIATLARNTGEEIAISGAEAANRLALSTQVPIKKVFLTTGTTRHIKVGSQEVLLKHVSPSKIVAPGSKVGLAITALWYLGKDNVNEATLRKLQQQLTPRELTAFYKEIHHMPRWMAAVVCRYRQEIKHDH
jgi:hypothetical protein